MRILLVPLVIAGLMPLASCDSVTGLFDSQPVITLDPGPVCPATGVLAEAASVTKLKPGASAAAPKPADIAFQAEMSQAMLDCNYNRISNTLSLSLKFAVRASRGPGASGADPQLPFFVAIIDSDNNVLSKQVYNSAPLMEGRANATYTESVSSFPVPLAMDRRPSDYEILTGFQLTPDELAYNRLPKNAPAAQTR